MGFAFACIFLFTVIYHLYRSQLLISIIVELFSVYYFCCTIKPTVLRYLINHRIIFSPPLLASQAPDGQLQAAGRLAGGSGGSAKHCETRGGVRRG